MKLVRHRAKVFNSRNAGRVRFMPDQTTQLRQFLKDTDLNDLFEAPAQLLGGGRRFFFGLVDAAD